MAALTFVVACMSTVEFVDMLLYMKKKYISGAKRKTDRVDLCGCMHEHCRVGGH
jgi:hypothetical protein